MKLELDKKVCECGKAHVATVEEVFVGHGIISGIPDLLEKYKSKKPFILADRNTYEAAGKRVCHLLADHGFAYSSYVFAQAALEPDEAAVGSAVMHFDHSCDLIIGVGSGVINDIGKILSRISGRKYIIVATAPSMDGYASATSSMSMDGLKTSLNSRCADVIIGDIDILKNAPEHMLKAGLGDMLAKYVSIAEWRIAHLITGEYYCETVADLVRTALKKCVDNAEGLLRRDDAAIEAVFEGLVIGGVAMAYTGVSRPASGVEHYFSHVWDMRGLEFGTKVDLHGIQCAVGTLLAARLYDQIRTYQPDEEKAKAYVSAFSYEEWKKELRALLGKGAEAMIALEEKEGKYNPETHAARYDVIVQNWEEIQKILEEELPSANKIAGILDTIGICGDPKALDIDRDLQRISFKATKDIRDKYVLSRLAWDLGILEDLAKKL